MIGNISNKEGFDMNICIYAAASENIDKKYIIEIEELGSLLAKEGHQLVYGAGSTGLMGAAARGFKKENGIVIGVTPEFMDEKEPLFEDCTELITTKTMAERKWIMEKRADAFLIVPGGIGTMDEFFQVVTLVYLELFNRPIIVYNYDHFYTKLLEFMTEAAEKGFINERVKEFVRVAKTKEEILGFLK